MDNYRINHSTESSWSSSTPKDRLAPTWGYYNPNHIKSLSSMRGYLAFPPLETSQSHFAARDYSYAEEPIIDAPSCTNFKEDDTDRTEQDLRHAWEDRLRRDEEARQKRLEVEGEIASKGEIDWVRSGGVLRDAQGRRDEVRTKSIRAELRLQKEENELMERWNTYERRWQILITSTEQVRFGDIPWPVKKLYEDPSQDLTLGDITSLAIAEFLLESLRVRSNTVTRKERIRYSLLRWHPDKISMMLSRVIEEDVQSVREGISAVIMCLKSLQVDAH